eukprot:3421020-Pleurochrysis_carterae.AAC.2
MFARESLMFAREIHFRGKASYSFASDLLGERWDAWHGVVGAVCALGKHDGIKREIVKGELELREVDMRKLWQQMGVTRAEQSENARVDVLRSSACS